MREYMWGLYSHSREYRKIFLRDHFPHISQILEGLHFCASTCCACIRTHANTGKYSWRIIYVLVSCQGVIFYRCRLRIPRNFGSVTLANLPTRVPACLLNNAKSPVGMTDLKSKGFFGALVISTVILANLSGKHFGWKGSCAQFVRYFRAETQG